VIEASCHCGDVRLRIAHAPSEVTDCNCSLCRRYGALWAYYTLGEVDVAVGSGETDIYMWGDRSNRFHRCRTCGCVTHWSAVDQSRNRMGVNARLLPFEVLVQARVRRLDGAVTWTYLDE